MSIRHPIELNEWYHCFNRGVDKRKIFQSKSDYDRFLTLMYAGNRTLPVHVSNLKDKSLHAILSDASIIDRGDPLVEIGTYCLMPNHFHFLLKEIRENGISTFMQKIFTGYTMYFNKKYERTGALFAGPFKSKHVPEDEYFKQVISYIHLNPVELYEPRWKTGQGNMREIEEFLNGYRYSGLADFLGAKRPENAIVAGSLSDFFDSIPSMTEMLTDAQEYYRNIKARP